MKIDVGPVAPEGFTLGPDDDTVICNVCRETWRPYTGTNPQEDVNRQTQLQSMAAWVRKHTSCRFI